MIDAAHSLEKSRGESLTRHALQTRVRPHAIRAIEVAAELLEHGNENVRLGAAKLLLAKVLPDLKSSEITDEDGKSLIAVLLSNVKKAES